MFNLLSIFSPESSILETLLFEEGANRMKSVRSFLQWSHIYLIGIISIIRGKAQPLP